MAALGAASRRRTAFGQRLNPDNSQPDTQRQRLSDADELLKIRVRLSQLYGLFWGRMPRAPRLLDLSKLPDWQKEDNTFLESGYRPATPTFLLCLSTWLYVHNETVNIGSHLIGALLFYVLPALLYDAFYRAFRTATPGELAVFAVYLFGVAGCYTLSVLFHTLMSHSPGGFAFGIQLDFQGIILLIWSATAPMVYYTFYHEPDLQITYWSLSSAFAVLASIITFTRAFRAPATKPLRAGVFGSLALSTLTCVIHGLIIHGWTEQNERFPMWSVALTLFFNTTGATIYVLRFPERWWRRRFDILGASHQLMHVSILIASFMWLGGMLEAFDHLHARLRLDG